MIRLIRRSLLFILLVFLLLVTTIYGIPDGNDYAKAIIDKHNLLNRAPSPRIIFVGGSNLAFSLDSKSVQDQLHYNVVNMGMNAFIGLRFMFGEVRSQVRAGDVVVLCLEYDKYFESVDGDPKDIFALAKVYPRAMTFLESPGQYFGVLKTIPFAASYKVMNLLRTTLTRPDLMGRKSTDLQNRVERRSAFNQFGDVVAHLEINETYVLGDDRDLSGKTVSKDAIRLINDFHSEAIARGARLVVMYSPIARSYYEIQRGNIDALHTLLSESVECPIVGSPEDFVYPDSCFFDSVYHTNRVGRPMRTEKVIHTLEPLLAPKPNLSQR